MIFCFILLLFFLQKQMENKQNRKFLDLQKKCLFYLWSSNVINHINMIQYRIFMIFYQVLGYISIKTEKTFSLLDTFY